MNQLTCLRCKTALDSQAESCPQCGERVTHFQRTYASKLLDGKYQIIDRLGLGGMGEIFKVRHIHLNEQRVVKIMRSNIASDEQALQRFLHEARLATMIKHRNLAMLYDFSTLEDGSYYMVWEFIEGTNIQKWIADNGPMPGRLAMEVAIQALAGLEALHQMGIIHRDISPENIMLSQDHMNRLLVKVIDFGIAKQLDEHGSGQGLTQTGMFLGKLKYASPEQAGFLPEGENLDARSDLYSFGVVFYEMLAGRAPFVATSPQSYLLKHATEKPAPIAQVAPNAQVHPMLEAVALKSLEKNRDDRQASAAEFIAELESLRELIKPDPKYGVGERLTTVSSRPTAVDLTRPTSPGTKTGGTAPTVTPKQAPHRPTVATRSAADEATMVEFRPTASGSDEATMVGQPLVPGGMHRTVSETIGGGAAATVLERSGTIAPTVADRELPKSKLPLWLGIAAAVLIVAAIGGYLAFKPKPAPSIPTTTDVTGVSSTEITTTAPPVLEGNSGVAVRGIGATLVRVESADTGKEVKLSLDDPSIPVHVVLPPGKYNFVLKNDRTGTEKTHTVLLSANQFTPLTWKDDPSTINYDSLAEEITRKK
jgi:serine/threonine protein kinase